jgi:hypothetical protein
MEELEALNMLLRLIGSTPVNSLGTARPDVANAKVTLDRIRKLAHKRGWWFNIDYNVTYQADPTSKEIVVGKEIISFVGQQASQYVVRGTRLYDKNCQTYQIGKSVLAYKIVRILDWDDMPNSMQDYCAYLAAMSYVRDELEDESKIRQLANDTQAALIELKRDDLQQGQYNIFNHSRVRRARAGVQPYASGQVRFSGDPDV